MCGDYRSMNKICMLKQVCYALLKKTFDALENDPFNYTLTKIL